MYSKPLGMHFDKYCQKWNYFNDFCVDDDHWNNDLIYFLIAMAAMVVIYVISVICVCVKKWMARRRWERAYNYSQPLRQE